MGRLFYFVHLPTVACLGLCVITWIGESRLSAQDSWPNWRGPHDNGASLTASPPTQWDASSGLLWKSPIEGEGSSTPIVWDQQIILLSAFKTDKTDSESVALTAFPIEAEGRLFRSGSTIQEPEGSKARRAPSVAQVVEASDMVSGGRDTARDDRSGGRRAKPHPTNLYQFLVSSFDLRTGAKNWQLSVVEDLPHEGGHETNNFASCSPATDGKHIYVFWGSRGIFCLNMQGNLLWSSDLGQKYTRSQFGEGASAALHHSTLIVPWDHESESYIAALNTENGDLKWKSGRAERTTWATPLVVEFGGQTQVIMHGRIVRSYDFRDGTLLWECGGQTENPIPTPVVYQQNVIVMSGFRDAACDSISLSSRGNVSNNPDSVRWKYPFNTPYVPSPTLYQDKIYFLEENQGVLTCLNAATGKPLYARRRIAGLTDVYASVGAADGKIYIVDRSGTTAVVDAGESGEVIATNRVAEDETFDASPVFVNDRLLLRSNKHLYCIGKPN
jgi:outer membrane protein assembly factor BamB